MYFKIWYLGEVHAEISHFFIKFVPTMYGCSNSFRPYVLSSSSIWMCQILNFEFWILNIEYLLLFFCRQGQWKKQNKYSKFKIRHVQIDELPRTLVRNIYLILLITTQFHNDILLFGLDFFHLNIFKSSVNVQIIWFNAHFNIFWFITFLLTFFKDCTNFLFKQGWTFRWPLW